VPVPPFWENETTPVGVVGELDAVSATVTLHKVVNPAVWGLGEQLTVVLVLSAHITPAEPMLVAWSVSPP
jgi:hypothetical protein